MKFDILYLDAPWKYDNGKSANPAWGGKEYACMSDKELANIPFADIANKDALMFCWLTMPRLLQGLELMRHWGFVPSTCGFVWVKLNKASKGIWDASMMLSDDDLRANDGLWLDGGVYSGLGSYTCGNVELCYIGKRGKALTRSSKSVKQVVFAPLGRHSAKPVEVAKRIDILYGPEYKRVEFFARNKPWNDHWTATGFQYDDMDVTDFIKKTATV